jgi:hypothetical protein
MEAVSIIPVVKMKRVLTNAIPLALPVPRFAVVMAYVLRQLGDYVPVANVLSVTVHARDELPPLYEGSHGILSASRYYLRRPYWQELVADKDYNSECT